jgi:NADH pyrophosphatase NudC (nudix superfamily)
MIRDQLILHTNCGKIRGNLLLENDDLTLAQAIKIALQVEASFECAASLSSAQNDTPADSTQPETCPVSSVSFPDSVQVASQPRDRSQQQCGNYGSSTHNYRAQVCPAWGKTCSNCGKLNHFHKVCRYAPTKGHRQYTVTKPTVIHNVHSG